MSVEEVPISLCREFSQQTSSYPFEITPSQDYNPTTLRFDAKTDRSQTDVSHSDEVRGKVQINARPGQVSYVPKKIIIKTLRQSPHFGWSSEQQSTQKPHQQPHHPPHQKSHHQPHHQPDHQPPTQQPSYHTHSNLQLHTNNNTINYNDNNNDEMPAWMGTLKSSNGPKPWEMQESTNLLNATNHYPSYPPQHSSQPPFHPPQHLQEDTNALSAVHQPKLQVTTFSPNSVTYQQHNPQLSSTHETARVSHSQYNTPLGLYSAANVTQVLQLQTAGNPGHGTLKIVAHGGNKQTPVHSDVFELVREEEGGRWAKRRNHNSNQQSTNHSTTHQPTFAQYSEMGRSDF